MILFHNVILQEVSASLGAVSHDDNQMKEMREALELLKTEVHASCSSKNSAPLIIIQLY